MPSTGRVSRKNGEIGAKEDKRPSHAEIGRPAKRYQVSRACERCRKLQKACSAVRPCRRCTKAGLEQQCANEERVASQHSVSPSSLGRQFHDLNYTIPAPFVDLATSPRSSIGFRPLQKQGGILTSSTIDYCISRFFVQLYPTIPILSSGYLEGVRDVIAGSDGVSEAYCLITALCALVLLQVENPVQRSIEDVPDTNDVYGRQLFEEALAARDSLHRRSHPSLEAVLITFLLYACHSALSHHAQAFFFLREATTLIFILRTDELASSMRELASNLFWVLVVSERSHALRYRRPISVQITPGSPTLSLVQPCDTTQAAFLYLAALFRPISTSFISLWNQEDVLPTASATVLLSSIEDSITAAIPLTDSIDLLDSQKSNLRVTQIWLQTMIWQLRLRLGLLSGPQQDQENVLQGSAHSHENQNSPRIQSSTYHYPLYLAKALRLSTHTLPLSSMQVHGLGLTEKIFDMTSSIMDVMARVPVSNSISMHVDVGLGVEDDLKYLIELVDKLPGGQEIYNGLLHKHLEATLPDLIGSIYGDI